MISFLVSQGASVLSALPLRTYAVLLALAAAFALWLWIAELRADLAERTEERDALLRRVSVQQALLAQRERALEALAIAERQAAARLRASSEAREEAIHAPSSEDGPVAPVLRRAFERLR